MTADVAASVRARLLGGAKARGEVFERTLSRFAIERLLYRLGASTASSRCVLKGAGLLAVWLTDPYRGTRDIDLLASGPADDDAIRALIEEVCAVPCVEDGLRFDLTDLRIDTIRPDEEVVGKRARFLAYLGTARIRMQVDLGFGDAVGATLESIEYPTILAELPAPRLRAYPRDASVAEKFEAMVKLDTRNSRMKDFHDIWALAGTFGFDGLVLQKAVVACFERRGASWTAALPGVLGSAFYSDSDLQTRWRGYLRAGAFATPPPASFEFIGERVCHFLGPLRAAVVAGGVFARHWAPGGPWR